MNILRLSTLSLTLAIAVFSLGNVNSSFAAPKKCVDPNLPGCGGGGAGGGGNDSGNLMATFCLTIDVPEPPSNYIQTDRLGPPPDSDAYCDEERNVQVSTGSGPGFRWDPNTQNTVNASQKFATARSVYMNILDSHDDAAGALSSDLKFGVVDFRFRRDPGLDLGILHPLNAEGECPDGETCSGFVLATLHYQFQAVVDPNDLNPDGIEGNEDDNEFNERDWGILGFGALGGEINETDDENHDFARDCLADSAPGIRVTRRNDDTWTLESNPDTEHQHLACRFALVGNGGAECTNTHECTFDADDRIRFEFKFTLVQEPE